MIGHAWQMLVRCTRCGFQIVVPETHQPRALIDSGTEMRLHAERLVTRADIPCPRCKEEE